MRPSKAILAVRAASGTNGTLGRRPIAEEGKRRSSQNAIRHGLAASSLRLRRLWTIETRLFDHSIEKRTETDECDRLAGAFSDLAAGNFLVFRELGMEENNKNNQTNLDSDKPF